MNRATLLAAFVALLVIATGAFAQSRPLIYIEPTDDSFQTYIAAAISKKHVPVSVVENRELATYILKAVQPKTQTVSTGKRIVNCLFADCIGNEDTATTSVTLTTKEGIVDWSYAVNKERGAKNLQSMAEAIAKHLKDHLEDRR